MTKTWVLWIGQGHAMATCVEVPVAWLALYRRRVTGEWCGCVLGVYRRKSDTAARLTEVNHISSEDDSTGSDRHLAG